MPAKPTAVGMHIYSGAWTLGFMDDFEILGQWEELDAGTWTFRKNLGDKIPHVLSSSAEWPVAEIMKQHDYVNLVYANPPCAPWSTAGAKLGMNDPRIQFAKNVSMVGKSLQPDFFIVESVCRAWSPTGGRPLYQEMAKAWGEAGYAVTVWFTNTVLHGAPQYRERFHFIAHRFKLDLDNFTPPTAAEIVTVRDAIEDLEMTAVSSESGKPMALPNHNYGEPKQKALNVMERLQEGEGWERGIERAQAEGLEAGKARFIAGRIRYDAPSPTLLDISQVAHPTQPRTLTVREAARLCGYPDWYEFGPLSEKMRDYRVDSSQLTQAALPFISRFIGDRFTKALDRADDVTPLRSVDDITIVDYRPHAKQFRPRIFER